MTPRSSAAPVSALQRQRHAAPYLRRRDMAPQERPPRCVVPSQWHRPRRGPVAAHHLAGIAAAPPYLHPPVVARRSPAPPAAMSLTHPHNSNACASAPALTRQLLHQRHCLPGTVAPLAFAHPAAATPALTALSLAQQCPSAVALEPQQEVCSSFLLFILPLLAIDRHMWMQHICSLMSIAIII
jgi:hypothetical protein